MASMNPFSMFETDDNLEAKGIRVDYGAFWFQIGRMDVPGTAFASFMREAMRPYQRAIQLGQMDEKVAEQIMLEGFSKHLIFAWGSQKHGDGKMIGAQNEAIDFTPENVADVLKRLPKLFQDLMEQARDFRNFRKEEVEVDAKN